MSKKRVHELAKEYGLDTKDVLQLLQAAGVDVKSHSSSVYEEEARTVLGKSKVGEVPAEVAPVAAKRPGMMIVKKKHVEVEAEGLEPSVPAHDEPEGPAYAAGNEGPVEDTAAAQLDDATATDINDDVLQPSIEPPAEIEASVEPESQAGVVTTESPSRIERAEGPAAEPKASGLHAPAHEPPRGHVETRETTVESRGAHHHVAVTTTTAVGHVGATGPRPRPGVATVVRMIDREKLMERVPSRRLGGQTTGAPGNRGPAREGPGQRFGQVTELKVVTDPFGRGREMINVGRDRKSKVAPVTKVVKKDRSPSKRDLLEMRERVLHPSRLRKKKSATKGIKKSELTERKASKRVIRMKESMVVADLAHQLGVKVTEVIAKLMGLGMMITQNQSIDLETATLLAAEYEYTVESIAFDEAGALETTDESKLQKDDTGMQPRPPVVTVMGHVDHGKTSLLDAIRTARVAAGEAGGITQHIGAYQVEVPGKGSITFLDTPGHAAFTAMRARGAQVTDLVILVVAADDGVMPQTEEAVKHAQAAKVPIIVAVNKIDRPDAKPDRVMQELASKFELTPEAWGGQTLYVNTSATKGTGIAELLEAVLLQAEVLELKANADRPAQGVVLEAKLDRGRGPVATVLIASGTLKRGDAIVVGENAGKVRAMQDDQGRSIEIAGPSSAVEITGIEAVPAAGDTLRAVDSSDIAREIALHRTGQKRAQDGAGRAAVTLEDMMKRMKGADGLEVKVVLKADVQGSVEAVRDALVGLSNDEVKVNVVYAGVGGISESDITLAAASSGIVLGFNVRPDGNSRELADREGVQIRSYNIIYEALEDIRLAMQGLLAPESREKLLGHAAVREVFRITKVGQIAGCRLDDGKALRSARVRILRDSVQVHDGKVASLKHFKNDVREVEAGQECGVGVENFNDIKVGDTLEFYQIEEIARTLAPPTAPGKRPGGGSGASAQP